MMRFSGETVSEEEIEVLLIGRTSWQLGWLVLKKPAVPTLSVLSELELASFQEIINEADIDHNGLIDYTEFFMLLTPKKS